MHDKQHTIGGPAVVSGVGLHTGKQVTMRILPAAAHSGIRFRRTDLPGRPEIPALTEFVSDTRRSTTLSREGATVQTVEHTLAALAGLQIDNVIIEIDASETPAGDGSSAVFVDAIRKAGIQIQDAEREYFHLTDSFVVNGNGKGNMISAAPGNEFAVNVIVEFDSESMANQEATMNRMEEFESSFANARTFCFLHEVEALADAGLIKGGDIERALVLVTKTVPKEQIEKLAKRFGLPALEVREGGVLGIQASRHENEPARHKLLDLVGDLSLAGKPIRGSITAKRPGHQINVELAKKIRTMIKEAEIRKKYQASEDEGIVFDINAIQRILPHRYPFLLVDRITRFSQDHIEGIKNVTINEPFFQGHFPGNPIMPGVLQLEAMGQIGGILLLNKLPDPEKIWVYFVGMDNVKFKNLVRPGDTIHFKLDLVAFKRNICKMTGQGYVDGKLVCSADLTAAFVPRDEKKEQTVAAD